MEILKQIIKCKLFGTHTVVHKNGYGHRCNCCGKTKREIRRTDDGKKH